MLRRIEPCCATGTNVPVWLSSSRTLLTESDSLRGCYELGPERLTNAENRARRRTDLTEKAAFPCGLFAEFITLSSRVWAELAKERFVTRRYRSVPPAGSRNLPRMTVLPLTDLM